MIEALSGPIVRTLGVCVHDRMGLPLERVVQFVQRMRQFRSRVQIRNGEMLVDGKNILEILMLAADWKSKLEVDVVGYDADQAAVSIEAFFF